MASRRKSTVPCMVRATEAVVQEGSKDSIVGKAAGLPEQDVGDGWSGVKENCENDCEVIEGKSSPANPVKKLLGGYECKYCPYSSQNLNEFTEHIDTQHPNVILNPLYVCAECNYKTKKYDSLSEHNAKLHPGESNFKLKLMKLNNQTILAQSIEVSNHPVAAEIPEIEVDPFGASVPNKVTPNVNTGKSKGEAKKASLDNHMDGFRHLVTETSEPIACINAAELLQDVLAHVMPSVQLPPNINLVPKVPVPLNTTKYNSALDTNATMISSFNKFPYPTQAELSWLTAASKHPEEQIRIWFATQRLKHGISWSPEEVEEARKKMFNGTIQPTAPQTITVLPAHVTPAKMPQPIIQTAVPCQILGQTGLVLTQVSNGSSVTPITLAVAASQGQKRCALNQPAAPEVKRPHVVPTESTPKQNPPAPPSVTPTVPSLPSPAMPLISPNDRKKTKEQIAALKSSFLVSQFPDNTEIYRLIEITGLARSEIKKWFSDHRYRSQRGIVTITSESIAKDQVALAAVRQGHTYDLPLDLMAQTFKDKSQEQLGILEESFLKSSFPTQNELERLRTEAKMNRKEVDYWFAERRKLRDNMEQAVLDSMGSSTKSQEEGTSNGAVSQTEQLNVSQAPPSLSRCPPAFATNSQEQAHLLKSTFARTQWPSPQEYDELAAQTGLTRTEIVRWFKENRSSLRSGTLKWLDQYQQQYGLDGYKDTKGAIPVAVTKIGSNVVQQAHKEFPKTGKLNREGMDRSESNSQDSQGNEESGDVSWVEVTIDDDYTTSDGTDSSTRTVPEVKVEYDPESVSGDNSHT
ncbi:UNVERIFIED_CONTAM: hypothetical protein K2H54_023042 [Gekko kuhli]